MFSINSKDRDGKVRFQNLTYRTYSMINELVLFNFGCKILYNNISSKKMKRNKRCEPIIPLNIFQPLIFIIRKEISERILMPFPIRSVIRSQISNPSISYCFKYTYMFGVRIKVRHLVRLLTVTLNK